MKFARKESYGPQDLVEIIRILRAPGGCPWDREQTHASIRMNFIEETYEAVEAIDKQDSELLCEELGDVLMQVFLHSQIAEEEGVFTLDEVVDGISRKMIYRHPHVFGDVSADTPDQVLKNWEELKQKEKGNPSPEQEIAAIPHCLPALIRTQKVQKKMERYYDVFQNDADSYQEAREALDGLKKEEDAGKAGELAGQLLLHLCNLLRLKNISGEQVLTEALEKLLKLYEIV